MMHPISLPLTANAESLATLSHPSDSIWELELHNGTPNTLTTQVLLDCVSKALDIVEKDWRSRAEGLIYAPGAFVITGGRNTKSKYFSRGLAPQEVRADVGRFAHDVLHPVLNRLLAFPLPTIASINGHAYAGGFFLALGCDYRVMNAGCVAWLTELPGSFPIAPFLGALLNAKFPTEAAARKALLGAHQWMAHDLEKVGLVDIVVDPTPQSEASQDGIRINPTHDIHEVARVLAESKAYLAAKGTCGLIRKEIMRNIIQTGLLDTQILFPEQEAVVARSRL